MNDAVSIKSSDFWVKIVEVLQQNWAVVETEADASARIYFINDTSGVFDEMSFPSTKIAEGALEQNGFTRFSASADLQAFLRPPSAPFLKASHPNGPIYSSGRFWRS